LVIVASASATRFRVIVMQEWDYQLSHLVIWQLVFYCLTSHCLLWTNECIRSYQTAITPSCL